MHGGDDDDAAVAAALQRRPRVLGQQERAREQDGQQRIPAILGELRYRRDVLEAGVGDDGVEAPEALERRIDGAAVAFAGGEVRRERLAGRVVGGLEVDAQDAEAVADQALGDGAPDAACRAGDDDAAVRLLSS